MISIIILVVLVILCAIVGAIYAYIYFTRINPKANRGRKYTEANGDEEDGKVKHTHIFMFRKS